MQSECATESVLTLSLSLIACLPLLLIALHQQQHNPPKSHTLVLRYNARLPALKLYRIQLYPFKAAAAVSPCCYCCLHCGCCCSCRELALLYPFRAAAVSPYCSCCCCCCLLPAWVHYGFCYSCRELALLNPIVPVPSSSCCFTMLLLSAAVCTQLALFSTYNEECCFSVAKLHQCHNRAVLVLILVAPRFRRLVDNYLSCAICF